MVRLVTFSEGGNQRVGVELSDGGDIADVTKGDASIPTDMLSLLRKDGGIAAVKAAVEKSPVVKRADAKLLAPIYGPEKYCTLMFVVLLGLFFINIIVQ